VRPAGRLQLHHPATQVQRVRFAVDDVRGRQFNAFQLPGDRRPQSPEHLQVTGPLRGQVLGLRLVDQKRRVAGEHLRAERMLGMKMCGCQVQPAARCVVGRELQHPVGVAWPHPGVDDQHSLRTTDDPDVGYQSNPTVRDHHQVASHILNIGYLHNRVGKFVFGH